MLTSDGARLLVSATFAGAVLTGRASVALVLAAVAVIAVFDAMFSPAEIAAVANVVPAGQLPEAFARNQTRNYLVTLVGPPLGGLLYGLGRAVPFVVDTVSYLVSLLTVTAIRSPLQDPPVGRPTQHLLADIREGIAHVLASPFLRAVLVVAALLNLAVDGALFTTTITLRQQGTSAGLVGLAQGLFGAGGLLGAFAAGWLQRRLSFRGLLVTATVVLTVGLALATVLVGHLLMAVPVAVGLFFAPPVNAALFSRLAATTPDRIQARVISVIVLSATVAGALAPLLGGLLIHHSGPVTAMLPWTAATNPGGIDCPPRARSTGHLRVQGRGRTAQQASRAVYPWTSKLGFSVPTPPPHHRRNPGITERTGGGPPPGAGSGRSGRLRSSG